MENKDNAVAVILGGGHGTRLKPMSYYISKQLLPVYDKPMISYPFSLAKLAGIQEIALICRSDHEDQYKRFLEASSLKGKVTYINQDEPNGVAAALMKARDFISDRDVLLLLGDNIIYGDRLGQRISDVLNHKTSTIFFHKVQDPSGLGVGLFSDDNQLYKLLEKPNKFVSNWASIGLYFYKNSDLSHLSKLLPSARGELEITDFNTVLLNKKVLSWIQLGRGYTWFDNGTPERLLEAANFIRTMQNNQGGQIGKV